MLDGNKMTKGGWLQCWSKFKEIVSALEQIEMKDEDGNEIRGPLPSLEEKSLYRRSQPISHWQKDKDIKENTNGMAE